jgi:predicted ABC-type ATPase
LSRQNANQPSFWIVAGPNGSGKTSAYSFSDFEESFRSVWIINPDMLSLRIVETEGLELGDANLEAVNRIEAWLETSILAL